MKLASYHLRSIRVGHLADWGKRRLYKLLACAILIACGFPTSNGSIPSWQKSCAPCLGISGYRWPTRHGFWLKYVYDPLYNSCIRIGPRNRSMPMSPGDSPVNQATLLRYLVETLETLQIDYMIGGSQASMYYGEPRFTQDIDVVAAVTQRHIALLLQHFPSPDFYLSEDVLRTAIQHQSQFNIIHPASGLKIDVILPKDTPYDRAQFARRHRLPLLPDVEAYFARPEDIIIYKLLYYKEGGSEKHLRDIAGMLAISGDAIDVQYIASWVAQLALGRYWAKVPQPKT